jgi:hypothetical protein
MNSLMVQWFNSLLVWKTLSVPEILSPVVKTLSGGGDTFSEMETLSVLEILSPVVEELYRYGNAQVVENSIR